MSSYFQWATQGSHFIAIASVADRQNYTSQLRVLSKGWGVVLGRGGGGMENDTIPPSYCTAPEERRIINCTNMGHFWNYSEGNKIWLVGKRNISQLKFVRHKSSIYKSPYFIWQIPFIIPAAIPAPCVGRSAVSIWPANRGKAVNNVCETESKGPYTSLG